MHIVKDTPKSKLPIDIPEMKQIPIFAVPTALILMHVSRMQFLAATGNNDPSTNK